MTLEDRKELFFRMVTDFQSFGVEVMRVLAQQIENMNVQLREAMAASGHDYENILGRRK